jgi:hypothetical protein
MASPYVLNPRRVKLARLAAAIKRDVNQFAPNVRDCAVNVTHHEAIGKRLHFHALAFAERAQLTLQFALRYHWSLLLA